YWLPAATRTDCSGSAPTTFDAHEAPQLISADLPMCAVVSTFTTSTAPDRFTAAVPANPALTPIAAMSSLFVAVTLTPRDESARDTIVRGPCSRGSPAGCEPDLTRLCDCSILAGLHSVLGNYLCGVGQGLFDGQAKP